jgi:hypothetical protein
MGKPAFIQPQEGAKRAKNFIRELRTLAQLFFHSFDVRRSMFDACPA